MSPILGAILLVGLCFTEFAVAMQIRPEYGMSSWQGDFNGESSGFETRAPSSEGGDVVRVCKEVMYDHSRVFVCRASDRPGASS